MSAMKFVTDLGKGILGTADSTELWEEIVAHIPDSVLLKPGVKILNVASGHCTEADVIARRMLDLGLSSQQVQDSIYLIDKYRVFTNRAKRRGYENVLTMDFLEWETDMKFDAVLGNPPYNDGSAGRVPIYNKFLKRLTEFAPDHVSFIIPTNWFSQPNSKLGKEVRQVLRELGVYEVRVNPIDTFKSVTVGTCTVFCEREYTGDITLVDPTNTKQFVIDNFDSQVVPEFDTVSRRLLQRLKPEVPFTTYSGSKGNTNTYRVVTSYMCYNLLVEKPLNELKIIDPDFEKQSGYRVFAEFTTRQEAEIALKNLNSFWHSKLVQFIMRRTRTSTTLDNPQLSWIPRITIDKKFTDQDLYTLFNLTTAEIDKVEADDKKHN